jgi:IclR family transcriptional regulator, KDG regulon repressor
MADLKTRSVPSVEQALRILEVVASSKRGMPLAQLAQRLGIPRSSAHCLLLMLARNGFLHRNEASGRYQLGLRLFGLAAMAVNGIELRERALPLLTGLMKNTGITVHMALFEHGDAVVIERVEAPGPFRLATWVGKRAGLHCSGLGKAVLACLKPENLTTLVREHGLTRHNQNTISLMRELRLRAASSHSRHASN